MMSDGRDEAIDYAKILGTGQHGKLYFEAGPNGYRPIFRIFVLGDKSQGMQPRNLVEVYGVTKGKPGQFGLEQYGWKHHGRWEHDFHEILNAKKAKTAEQELLREQEKSAAEEAERQRIASILEAY